MSRDELIDWLLGAPGEVPAELRAAARSAFATATDGELQELAECMERAASGENTDSRAERLGELSGRRRLALEFRRLRG